MKKIVISGYYGFDNLGDEAILAGIISLFQNSKEEINLTVLSASPEKTAELYDVNTVSRNSLINILNVLAEADLFISGGGSLLQDITGNFSIAYYLGLAWLAKIQGSKTIYYAQGAGPINKKWNQRLTSFSLNRFDLLGVRDRESKKFLKNIGVQKEIKLSVDPVFALYDPLLNKKQKIKGKLEIGISVRPWSVDYIKSLASALNCFSRNKNVKYIIFPMHQGRDEKISQKLNNILESESEVRQLAVDPRTAVKSFSNLDLFVGVRLHSLIFALLNQIPLLALSYDPKIEGLLAEIDYLPLIKLEEINEADLVEKLENIFAERYSLRKKIADFLSQKRKKAENFAEVVLEEVGS